MIGDVISIAPFTFNLWIFQLWYVAVTFKQSPEQPLKAHTEKHIEKSAKDKNET